jgi:hypothetical protein
MNSLACITFSYLRSERILDLMRLDLSLPIEIRALRDRDLDGLEWDSEQAIQADYPAKLYRRLGYRDDGIEPGGNGEVIRLLRRPIADIEASA